MSENTLHALRFVALLAAIWLIPWRNMPKPEPVYAALLLVPPPTSEEVRTEAVIRNAALVGVNPRLALQVSRQENYTGVADAKSSNKCCVGIMQIHLRIWYGEFDKPCHGSDLLNVDINACYGVHILRYYLDQCGQDEDCALTRYRGAEDPEVGRSYVQLVRSRPTYPIE